MRHLTLLFFTVALTACSSAPSSAGSTSASRSSAYGFPPVAMKTYANTTAGYTIEYPSKWTVQENTRFVGPEVTEVGTVFAPPASDTDGTNLLKAQVEVTVLDGACPVIQNPQQEAPAVIDGVSFDHDLWGVMSGGNTEETITYQAYRNSKDKCDRIVYYRNFCTPGTSCTPDRTTHFAPGPQVHIFEMMARSFKTL